MPSSSPYSVLRGQRFAWLVVLLLCAAANLLALTSAIYMLQVYDRVLSSHSVPTLIALSVLVGGLYIGFGAIDILRAQLMVRIASRVDDAAMPAAHAASLELPLRGVGPTEAVQPIRDVDSVRAFLFGPGPLALADLPFAPLFLVLLYWMSPPLALTVAIGFGLLVCLALLTELAVSRAETATGEAAARRNALAEAGVRSAPAVAAMGMGPGASRRFGEAHDSMVEAQERASDLTSVYAAISRVVRLALQSLIVGLGAYLAIQGDITAGAIIAASIIAGRALAPVEQAIACWKGFVAFRRAWGRLQRTARTVARAHSKVQLPTPAARLTLEGVAVAIPDSGRVALVDIDLDVPAGTVLGIAGPSGSGKSTLARALVGAWPALRGSIRIDGAEIGHWPPAALGRHIGYLPQEIELLPGTVAENIARMQPEPASAAVVAAARAAGVHDMILRLPNGYDTPLGAGAAQLSGGQRQRLALARALYEDPFLLVLDEPNAHLDMAGEGALMEAIEGVRARGGIVIVIAHRNRLLSIVDRLVVIDGGRIVQSVEGRKPALDATAGDRSQRPARSSRATLEQVR